MRINIEKIIIDKNQVLKFLGYANRNIPQIILRKIDEEIEIVHDLLQPSAFIQHFKIDDIKADNIYFGKKYCLKSSYLAKELENSFLIYLTIYTIGDKIEDKIREYSNDSEMIRAMILDKIGIVALDNIRNQIKEVIIEEVFPYKISAQLFPATKDFDISSQKIILDVFKGENNIISISKYYQFNPIKTVSVIFNIGNVEDKKSICDECKGCNRKCFV